MKESCIYATQQHYYPCANRR